MKKKSLLNFVLILLVMSTLSSLLLGSSIGAGSIALFSAENMAPAAALPNDMGPFDFSIIQITDTQYLSFSANEFNDLTNWIVANAPAYNVKMVIHTGDIVNDPTDVDQWIVANNAMKLLQDNNVPYCWCVGNHDQIPLDDPNGTSPVDQYEAFDVDRLGQESYWVSDILDAKNTAVKFSYGTYTFMVINIENGANSTVINWMEKLLAANPNANVIVGTHDYIDDIGITGPWGLELQGVLDQYPNIFMTLNGHNFGTITDSFHRQNGDRTEVFWNKQEEYNGLGSDSVRIYEFSLHNNAVNALTYQVWNDQWLTDEDNQYSFSANLISGSAVWDFEDHTFSHTLLSELSNTQIAQELEVMNGLFQAHGLPPPEHIAYPEGVYTQEALNVISQYRLSGRLAGNGEVATYPVENWFLVGSISIQIDTTFNNAKTWIDSAIENRELLCLFTHDVQDTPTEYGCTPDLLAQILDYLVAEQNAGNLSVLTMRQAYTDYGGQKAVVVLSFDDGWVTDYTTAWPMFAERGLAGTSYLIGNSLVSGNPDGLTWDMVHEMTQTPAWSWSITIESTSTQGSVTPSGKLYTSGSLTVTAHEQAGYTFSHWLFDNQPVYDNPLFLPEQAANSAHALTAYFTQTLNITVDTDRTQYMKWSYVHITAQVTDTSTDQKLANIPVAVYVYDTHNKLAVQETGITNTNGSFVCIYKLMFDAQTGTYTVTASATPPESDPIVTQTTFYSTG